MTSTAPDDTDDVLPTLLLESARFVDAMLTTVAVPVRVHLPAAALPIVVVAVAPFKARLLLQTPDGDTKCLTSASGRDIPAALGTAVAAFLDVAMQLVSEPWRAVLSSADTAVDVSVVVEVMGARSHLVVDDGGPEPRVLATLTLADEEEVVH